MCLFVDVLVVIVVADSLFSILDSAIDELLTFLQYPVNGGEAEALFGTQVGRASNENELDLCKQSMQSIPHGSRSYLT